MLVRAHQLFLVELLEHMIAAAGPFLSMYAEPDQDLARTPPSKNIMAPFGNPPWLNQPCGESWYIFTCLCVCSGCSSTPD